MSRAAWLLLGWTRHRASAIPASKRINCASAHQEEVIVSGLIGRAAQRRTAAASRRKRLAAATAAVLATTGVAALAVAQSANAASGCQVSYTVASSWPGGFSANVSITNLGS